MNNKVQRVLVIDPDPLFAKKATVLLSSQGYDVETADGITAAVQRLKVVNFGCVIMDEALPEMKGYEAVPVLKAISPDVKIIMTAALNSLELEARIRREDIFFYYVKTFDVHELQMAVCNSFLKNGMSGNCEEKA